MKWLMCSKTAHCNGTLKADGYDTGCDHRGEYWRRVYRCDVCGEAMYAEKHYVTNHKPIKEDRR